jgi:hypothetical protein
VKIKIGENEYVAPFTTKDDPESGRDWFVDANGKFIRFNDACLALNELAQLRQERDSLQKRVDELEKALDIANNQERCGQ